MSDSDAKDLTMGPGTVPPAPLTPEFRKFIRDEEARKLVVYVPPGDASGATTGWGWDFGGRSEADVRRVWGPLVEPWLLTRLLTLAGKKGAQARVASAIMHGVTIPGAAVDKVFELDSIPEYQARMDRVYTPKWRLLPAAVQWALFSLTYNRGGVPLHTDEGLEGGSTDHDRYDNERSIRQAVEDLNVPRIVQCLDLMAIDGPDSLWPGTIPPNPVLRKRRGREARLAETSYPSGNRA